MFMQQERMRYVVITACLLYTSNIFARKSVRAYTSQPIEKEKVDSLVKAAMAAPTAVNKQPWAFVVVDDRTALDKLAAELPYAKMTAQAPLAIVVCGD